MRVAHIIHSLQPGGAESLLVELARVAPGAGMEMAVVPLVDHVDRRLTNQLAKASTPVLHPRTTSRWDPTVVARTTSALRRWRPDVIHTHLKHADIVGAVASRALHVPMVSTLHMIEDDPGPMLRAKRRLALTARTATSRRTIAVSEAQRQWYMKAFSLRNPERVVTIRNGVADVRRKLVVGSKYAVRRSIGVPEGAVMVLQIGMFRQGKGHRDLLSAWDMLPPGLGAHLVLAGDGPLRPQLEQATHSPNSRVHFLGYRSDVAELLDASDLVAHPSEFDALPTALLETLAAGRAVVATTVGGIPEIVGPSEGVLVPPGRPRQLADAITGLAVDEQRRQSLGAHGRRRYEAEFDVRSWAARLALLYAQVYEEVG